MSTTITISPFFPKVPMEVLASLCRRYGVRELSLFGSMAKGEATENSDIDLLVDFIPETFPDLFTIAGMQRELTELLGRKVDLVTKGGLKPLIRDAVLASAKVVYSEPPG
jgi:predicted nucleotidyltransferase